MLFGASLQGLPRRNSQLTTKTKQIPASTNAPPIEEPRTMLRLAALSAGRSKSVSRVGARVRCSSDTGACVGGAWFPSAVGGLVGGGGAFGMVIS